ncbi:gacY [Symbiodinium sp. CCMP2456]|nr:gacY [Symbiodinium sp. CCMP2456]
MRLLRLPSPPCRTSIISEADLEQVRWDAGQEDVEVSEPYRRIIEEAKSCIGFGAARGSFPEEWDAQLLVDCGATAEGQRIVLFTPGFLQPILNDADELDRAFHFLLLHMDEMAMQKKYVFVYCCLGMDWSAPLLAERLQIAFEILPRKYTKNLKRFYVLHATSSTHVTMWSFYAWLTPQFWDKIQFVNSIETICEDLHPNDESSQEELRRRFPQVIQRQDALRNGDDPPVNFGVPIRAICNTFGVDFTDKTTGRWYPKLPPAVIFLCEALEREAADEEFGKLFEVDPDAVFPLLNTIDYGNPLPRDLDPALLWCCLKVWLDCLPSPLLSFEAMNLLQSREIQPGNIQRQREYLIEIFHEKLPEEVAYVALYISSFLHTMCNVAQDRWGGKAAGSSATASAPVMLTPSTAAKVFASGFLRPRVFNGESMKAVPAAESLIATLIEGAEEKDLWIGGEAQNFAKETADSESDAESP